MVLPSCSTGVELYTLLEIEVNDDDFPTMEEVPFGGAGRFGCLPVPPFSFMFCMNSSTSRSHGIKVPTGSMVCKVSDVQLMDSGTWTIGVLILAGERSLQKVGPNSPSRQEGVLVACLPSLFPLLSLLFGFCDFSWHLRQASKSRAFQLIQEAYEYLSDSEPLELVKLVKFGCPVNVYCSPPPGRHNFQARQLAPACIECSRVDIRTTHDQIASSR